MLTKYLDSFDLAFVAAIFIRFALATVLSGLTGYEREHSGRPAGFRSHILVCVGACLVMRTADFMFRTYSSVTSLDPARLGAQVISGIKRAVSQKLCNETEQY